MRAVTINGVATEHLLAGDRGLHYGDGVFETIACVDGALLFWEQHLQRMRAGAGFLDIAFPGDEAYFDDIRRLFAGTTEKNSVFKIMLTRGQGERGYRVPEAQKPMRIVIRSDWPPYSAELNTAGIMLCLCKQTASVNPALAGIKHLNRLDSVIARNEWDDEYDEGLMMDIDGNIIEGTMSNVFAVSNNTLYTPALERCGVDGIIRQQVLQSAQDSGIETIVGRLTAGDLYAMDELFITNSIIGIWPVRRFAEQNYPPGAITRKLANALEQRKLEHAKTLG